MPNENTTIHLRKAFHLHLLQAAPNMEMETKPLLPKATDNGGGRKLQYQLIDDGVAASGNKMRIIKLRRRPRMYWRIRFSALRWARRVGRSPLKLLAMFPNAYTNFMWRFAGNVGAISIDNIFGGKRAPKAGQVCKGYSGYEFEARLIFEISKALVASHELYPM